MNADVNQESKATGQTAVLQASANSKKESLELLVALNANINHENSNGHQCISGSAGGS